MEKFNFETATVRGPKKVKREVKIRFSTEIFIQNIILMNIVRKINSTICKKKKKSDINNGCEKTPFKKKNIHIVTSHCLTSNFKMTTNLF